VNVGTHFPKAANSGWRHAEPKHSNITLKKGSDEVVAPFEANISVFCEITPGEPAPKPEPPEIVRLRDLKL
jgi:hypothetical protein